MCSLLLVCAGLRTLHTVKHILNEEECRSVGTAGFWWDDELAIAVAVKPPSVVQKTLDILKRDTPYDYAAEQFKSKLCST